MKHYANHSSQNEPRRGAKPTGGKRYAPPEKKRDAIERDFFEKKPAELRIKRTSPAIETDPTKIFSVKQSDAAAGATQGKTEPDVYRKPLRRGDRADDVDVDSILRKHDALFASDLDEPDEARIPDFEEREVILDHEPGAAETAEAEQPAPQREERPKKAKTVCSGTPTAAAPPNKAGYLPAFVFAGFILTMSVLLLVLPKKDFSVAEKKQLPLLRAGVPDGIGLSAVPPALFYGRVFQAPRRAYPHSHGHQPRRRRAILGRDYIIHRPQ